MKKMILFFILFSAFSLQAQAFLTCNNGSIEEVGDAYFQIDLLEDGIVFMPYEASFSFDAAEINYTGDVLTIVDKVVRVSAEGEEFDAQLDAILSFTNADQTLEVALSYNKGPFYSYTMKCEFMNLSY